MFLPIGKWRNGQILCVQRSGSDHTFCDRTTSTPISLSLHLLSGLKGVRRTRRVRTSNGAISQFDTSDIRLSINFLRSLLAKRNPKTIDSCQGDSRHLANGKSRMLLLWKYYLTRLLWLLLSVEECETRLKRQSVKGISSLAEYATFPFP